ncbi:MAG: FMN-binding protein [Candidatus Nomurabacteria bacterium]|nr:MAG: FMN-binding protein [Candidatus Nomurabacteria bacterium]
MNRTIAKVAIGAFVAFTFVIYSTHQRSEGTQAISQLSANTTSQAIVNKASSTTTPSSSSTPVASSSVSKTTSKYKDGSFTGKSSDAFYGFIQVKATISGGKLTNVDFLDYPQDRSNSIYINQYAMPILKSQAIQVQSAQVDGVSGATDTSQAFIESLGDALAQARA